MHVIGWGGVEHTRGELIEKTTGIQCWDFSLETSSVDTMRSMLWTGMTAETFGNYDGAG